VVQPSKFKLLEFEWDEHNLIELERHGVEVWEAEDCFYNPHRSFRNKKKSSRAYETYKLEGTADSGRPLLLIFYVKEKTSKRSKFGATALIRVITGWER
jgi:uncharacterized DUF497 family protein